MTYVPSGIEVSVSYTANGYTQLVTGLDWTFTGAALDTTGFGDGADALDFDTFVGGRRNFAGSYTAKWDAEQDPVSGGTTTPSTGADWVLGYIAAGLSEVVFTFTRDQTTQAVITANIIITDISQTGNIDQAPDLTYTFQGSGAPVFTTLATSA